MHNKLFKVCVTVIVTFVTMSFAVSDDCNFKFGYNVQKSANASGNFSLEVYLKEGVSGTYTFVLYNLHTGTVIEKKKVNVVGQWKEVLFKNVKPSLYEIFIKTEQCERGNAIGGNDGIKVGIEN